MSAIQRTQKRRVVVEPFPASLLIADELPCALYHKTDQGRFERYIQSERPAGRKPDRVYISTENRPIVDRYLANQADHYIQNSDAPLAKKSHYLYTSTSQVLKRFFEDSTQQEALGCAADLAKSSMDMILNEPAAFTSLLKVSSHDYHTFSHSVDVMLYTAGLAQKVGLKPDQAREFAVGAVLHDVGKSQIPTTIINKQGRLSDEEFEQMKAHPDLGRTILGQHDTRTISQAVAYHHERFDGTGYPYGLKGDEIPLVAQMVTIADVFAALTTKRSYKAAMSSFEALGIMKNQMSGHFNPELFKSFVQLMGSQP